MVIECWSIMSDITANDVFHELFDENKRLIDEFSLNKRLVDVLKNYRQLLSQVFINNEFNVNLEKIKQSFDSLEEEYNTVEEDIRRINSQKSSKTSELRSQMMSGFGSRIKRLKSSSNSKQDFEEEDQLFGDYVTQECDDNQETNKTNVKFLSEDNRLIEEDGSVVTQLDPKNSLILGLI